MGDDHIRDKGKGKARKIVKKWSEEFQDNDNLRERAGVNLAAFGGNMAELMAELESKNLQIRDLTNQCATLTMLLGEMGEEN